jgi:hypothetical protein
MPPMEGTRRPAFDRVGDRTDRVRHHGEGEREQQNPVRVARFGAFRVLLGMR